MEKREWSKFHFSVWRCATLPRFRENPETIIFNRLNAEFTRTPEHRNAILVFKRNHMAAASQQKQVLVRLTGILQAFLKKESRIVNGANELAS